MSLLPAVSVHFATLALLLNLPKQGLVQLELLAIHFSLAILRFFLVDLLLQEVCVLRIDLPDFGSEPRLLILVVLLVTRPQQRLLVLVSFERRLSLLLLFDLPLQQLSHLDLFSAFAFLARPVLFAKTHLTLNFIASERVILCLLAVGLVLYHVTSHTVHILLSALLTGDELPLPVLLLLVKHAHVLFLSVHVCLFLLKFLSLSLSLVFFVFLKHFLEISTFLNPLLLLQLALSLHLLLESLHQFDLLAECLLLVMSAFALFFHQLPVATLLLLLSF